MNINTTINFNSNNTYISNLINSFNYISNRIYFSSKKVNYDEFDQININDTDIISEYINGCFSLISYPRGSIFFIKNNKWKMDLLNIYFMIKHNIIPNIYHDLPKTFKITRTNGDITDCKIFDLEAITISNKYKDLLVKCNFKKGNQDLYLKQKYNNSIEEIYCSDIYCKTMKLNDIMAINNFNNLFITLNLFSDKFLSKQNIDKKEINIYFNKKIMEWVEEVILPFFKNNKIKATVIYSSIH